MSLDRIRLVDMRRASLEQVSRVEKESDKSMDCFGELVATLVVQIVELLLKRLKDQ